MKLPIRAFGAALLLLAHSCTTDQGESSPQPALGSAGSAGASSSSGASSISGATGSSGSGGSAPATGGAGSGGSAPATGGAGNSGVGGGSGGSSGGPAQVCAVDPQRIYDDVDYFASDECRGRLPGDVGNELALDFAEQEFVAAGLLPGGDGGTYRQSFEFDDNGYSGITENVLAKIEGSDPLLKNEVILIGAHIDHLGVEGDDIYRGADDNASGAAVVLELARMFQRCSLAPKRTLVFVEWNAEEMGLIGSRYYVDNPILPLEDTIAVYNFDMVGAGDGTGVLLFGGDDEVNRWLTDLMINAADQAGLTHVIELVPQKLASDHAPFVEVGIPICWGFSRPDPHPGYHSPDDDIGNIKLDSLQAVSELFWAALRPLAMAEESNFL